MRSSTLFTRFLPSILSSLSCLKPAGRFSHFLALVTGVEKKSELGAWQT